VLFILQTRRGKRTPPADVKIAGTYLLISLSKASYNTYIVNLVQEGLINQREALCRINANQMDFFLHPMIDPALKATGLPGIQRYE